MFFIDFRGKAQGEGYNMSPPALLAIIKRLRKAFALVGSTGKSRVPDPKILFLYKYLKKYSILLFVKIYF